MRFGSRIRGVAVCGVLAVAAAWPATIPQVRGLVEDAQGLAIVGARITLNCRGEKEDARSDNQGRFVLATPGTAQPCLLEIRYRNFSTFKRLVRTGSGPLTIKLSIAPVKQSITVPELRHLSGFSAAASLDSTSLSRSQFRRISNNTEDLIVYAKLVAGTPPGPDDVYVDGLPARVLPPAEMISRITVNPDPFSAEYSDGNANHIEITTGSADRKLHFSLGGRSLGFGGGSPLASALHSSSRSISPNISGPVPHLPLTFSFEGRFGSAWSQQLVQAVLPSANGAHASPSIVPNGSNTDSGSLNLYYSKPKSIRAGLSYSQSSNSGWNSGVGGLTLADAGSGSAFGSREARAFLDKTGERWESQTGIVFDSSRTHLWANTTAQSVNVPGYFTAGGSPVSASNNTGDNWTWKTVFQSNSQKRFWTWGVTASRADETIVEVPNPSGELEFQSFSDYLASLDGASTGTLIEARGEGQARHATVVAAPFLQGEIWRSENSILRGGIRADYQSGGGVIVSPRLSIVSVFHGFAFRSGAGLFVHPWPNSALVHVLLDDGAHLQPFISTGVGYSSGGATGPGLEAPIVAAISPDFVRPRDILLKESVERTMANFTAGVEYTWTDGTHLLGSRRIPSASGWTDLLESDRLLRKQEAHVRLQYGWKGQNLIGNYEWVRSRDNTDGPFSFPEFQDNLHAEWAPSTGIPAHNASVVGNFRLPGSISLTVLGSWHSSTPYTILTGKDVNGDGLFNDRGGLPRNSGNGPAYRSVSLYAYRHLSLGRILNERKNSFGADVGVQIEDLLGNRNYVALDSVSSSPLFGQPLTAFPCRSVRLWFELTP